MQTFWGKQGALSSLWNDKFEKSDHDFFSIYTTKLNFLNILLV